MSSISIENIQNTSQPIILVVDDDKEMMLLVIDRLSRFLDITELKNIIQSDTSVFETQTVDETKKIFSSENIFIQTNVKQIGSGSGSAENTAAAAPTEYTVICVATCSTALKVLQQIQNIGASENLFLVFLDYDYVGDIGAPEKSCETVNNGCTVSTEIDKLKYPIVVITSSNDCGKDVVCSSIATENSCLATEIDFKKYSNIQNIITNGGRVFYWRNKLLSKPAALIRQFNTQIKTNVIEDFYKNYLARKNAAATNESETSVAHTAPTTAIEPAPTAPTGGARKRRKSRKRRTKKTLGRKSRAKTR